MIIKILDRTDDIQIHPRNDEHYRNIMREDIRPIIQNNHMVLCMQNGSQMQELVQTQDFEQAIETAKDADVLYVRPSITAG